MDQNKKNKIIGTVLIIAIIIGIIILAIWGYNILKGSKNDTGTVQQEENTALLSGNGNKSGENSNTTLSAIQSDSYTKKKRYMEDYEIVGELEIPKIDLKTNVLSETTKRSLEIAVTVQYPPASKLNQPGNTVIYGHNYRNSLFFSRNDELEIGDKFYIKDEEGTRKTYIIYDKFETTAADTSFYAKTEEQTGGRCEVTLSTCTDDASQTDRRLIILAREE